MQTLVAIELEPSQIDFFNACVKNFEPISFMLLNGAFQVKRGSVTLNFSDEGKLASLEKREFSYPHPKKV